MVDKGRVFCGLLLFSLHISNPALFSYAVAKMVGKWTVALCVVMATFALAEGSEGDRSAGDRSAGDRGITDMRKVCNDWEAIRSKLDDKALNKLESKEKRALFDCYDFSDDGKYSLTEFLNLMRLISGGGRPTNPENRKALFKSLDSSRDDFLQFDEFDHFDIIF